MKDPGEHLIQHRAPPGLMEEALRRARRPDAPSYRPILVAAAFLVGVASGGLIHRAALTPAPDAPTAQAPDARPDAPVPVRLVFYAPEAETVSVAGNFNEWDHAQHRMRSTADGHFVADLALPRGRYEYMFVIDGERWETDPTAPLTLEDDFGLRNAILEI